MGENKKENNSATKNQSKLAPLAPNSSKTTVNNSNDNIWDDYEKDPFKNKASTSATGFNSKPSTSSTSFTISKTGSKIQSSGFGSNSTANNSTKKEDLRPKTAAATTNSKSGGGANGFWDFEEFNPDDDDEELGVTSKKTSAVGKSATLNYNTNSDLNKLDKASLDKEKSKMDVLFTQN